MTLRGFLAFYLGSVVVVGATGVSAYQALLRRHTAIETEAPKPTAVAEAPVQAVPPPAPAPEVATPTPTEEAPDVTSLPKLRPPVAAEKKPAVRHRTVVAIHRPVHRPTMMASVRREPPAYQQRMYPAPPPPPGYYAYGYPTYYPYGGYYGYYSLYGYYRSF